MLPLGLNLHFSRVHFATLVADAVQAAPKNRVHRAYWQAQKSQNLAGTGWDMDFEVVPKQGPFGQLDYTRRGRWPARAQLINENSSSGVGYTPN